MTATLGGVTAYPDVTRCADAITRESQAVAAQTGVAVPVPVVESVMEIESQGNPNVGCSPDGYCGLMQTGPGSMGRYDVQRLATDPEYSIWSGINDLALREQDSGFMPWPNVADGYFSGHYQPTGARDSFGTTDTEYMSRFQQYLADFSQQPGGVAAPTGPNAGLPGAIDVTQAKQQLGAFGRHAGVYLIGGGLLITGLLWSRR